VEIQSTLLSFVLQSRFKQTLISTVKWIFVGILIAWIILCSAVSVLNLWRGFSWMRMEQRVEQTKAYQFSQTVKGGFEAPERELLAKAHAWARGKGIGVDGVPFTAGEIVLEHGADAAAIAEAIPAQSM
jgi:hypothetical protein